jgi:hypothetical protein
VDTETFRLFDRVAKYRAEHECSIAAACAAVAAKIGEGADTAAEAWRLHGAELLAAAYRPAVQAVPSVDGRANFLKPRLAMPEPWLRNVREGGAGVHQRIIRDFYEHELTVGGGARRRLADVTRVDMLTNANRDKALSETVTARYKMELRIAEKIPTDGRLWDVRDKLTGAERDFLAREVRVVVEEPVA